MTKAYGGLLVDGIDVSTLLPKKNGLVDLTSMVNDQFAKVTINGEDPVVVPTATWKNRFEMLYKPFGGTPKLVVYFNEYGELRVFPANFNTTAVRIYVQHLSTDTAHTGNILEVCDNPVDRNVLFAIDSAGNITGTNFGPQNQVSTTAPTDHNRVWINIS